MSQGKTQVLNLDDELTRHEITYKGATYELRNRSELSILEAQRFSALLKEHAGLIADEMDDETATKLGETLQSIAAVLVVDPPEGGFPDQLCAAILGFWSDQISDADPPQRAPRAPQDRKPKKSTGAK